MKVFEVYSLLTERERDILALRLQGQTLEQVGRKYGVTRERIRLLEGRMFAKLIRAIMFIAFEKTFFLNSEKEEEENANGE